MSSRTKKIFSLLNLNKMNDSHITKSASNSKEGTSAVIEHFDINALPVIFEEEHLLETKTNVHESDADNLNCHNTKDCLTNSSISTKDFTMLDADVPEISIVTELSTTNLDSGTFNNGLDNILSVDG
ncbi:unnamed protein product, partial [Callosobruchus maculatus]